MKIDLIPFQKLAVEELRFKADQAVQQYVNTRAPQVVSLQAPTGSGKTVMMTAFIENILCGDERHEEQPNAVFVWLSDSPALNRQSLDKITMQSDRIAFGQTVTVADASFDQETFDDGHIYFLNTQKLSRAGNLGQHADGRQWTIWDTIRNTAARKADRLYFIIDEAHRGMQGNEGGRQTAIMQRFLKGWPEVDLPPMPVVLGMSATPERFNKLVGALSSTIQKVVVPTSEVRKSGLLKDRIIITYPEDAEKQDAMAVLAAATKEWCAKCDAWRRYCVNQHYRQVDPVFVVQVKDGDTEAKTLSETDLDAALEKIGQVAGRTFAEGEVVHTFGQTGDIVIHGLKVPHVNPNEIAEDRRIAVVFFKENLSTGWDCPRAEAMMSFRRADDYTHIAQLLGRMIRTPLHQHVSVDDSLNEVRLYLPYFNAATVDQVITELKASECGDIPTCVEGDVLGSERLVAWGAKTRIRKSVADKFQGDLFANVPAFDTPSVPYDEDDDEDVISGNGNQEHLMTLPPKSVEKPIVVESAKPAPETPKVETVQPNLQLYIDRQHIIKCINAMGIIKEEVHSRTRHANDYLVALLALASLLNRTKIVDKVWNRVVDDITNLIGDSIAAIKSAGKYAALAQKIRELKLESKIFDAFGTTVEDGVQMEFSYVTESDLDRQLREADAKLGRAGITKAYGRKFEEYDESFKIDCIIFANDEACMEKLHAYAKRKFQELDDANRKYVAVMNDTVRNEYNSIVASSGDVSLHAFVLPENVAPMASVGGRVYGDHLYADENGEARIAFDSDWEPALVDEEETKGDFVCWLRNTARANWALGIAYEDNHAQKCLYPDFLVIRRDYNPVSTTGFIVDVLEPHSSAFSDNLPKAKGLARYATVETHLGRIEMIRREKALGGGYVFRRLDFSRSAVRDAVIGATSEGELNHIFERLGTVG